MTLGVALVAILVAIGGYFYPQSVLGAASGVAHYQVESFLQGLAVGARDQFSVSNAGALTTSGIIQTDGGELHSYVNATSTTATTQTLKVSDVTAYDTVILTPNIANDTVTFFASSTASSWLPAAGDSQRVCFINGTTTANIGTITLAGGTGLKLLVSSSTTAGQGSLNIPAQKEACINFTRANSTATTFDILGALTSYN